MVNIDLVERSTRVQSCLLLEEGDLLLDSGKLNSRVIHGILCLPDALELDQIRSEDASLLEGKLFEPWQSLFIRVHDMP